MNCVKVNWNFQRGVGGGGGGSYKKIPSVGEVWIFSGTIGTLLII